MARRSDINGRNAGKQNAHGTRKHPTRRTAARRPRASAEKAQRSRRGASRTQARGRQTSSRRRRASRTRTDSTRRQGITASLQDKKRVVALLVVIGCLLLAVVVTLNVATCQVSNKKFSSVEQWRSKVVQACTDCKLDTGWADSILAAIYIESGGDAEVSSVLGVEHDIMQAAEGKYGRIVKKGSKKYGVQAETCEASIYAGVLEFKQNLKLWKRYLDGIQPEESSKIQLVVQGYNFGADGWYKWCKANGIKSYTVDEAKRYSEEKMPENAKGTPTHAEKWLSAYQRIVSGNED